MVDIYNIYIDIHIYMKIPPFDSLLSGSLRLAPIRTANFKHYYIATNIETGILTILCREYTSNYQ